MTDNNFTIHSRPSRTGIRYWVTDKHDELVGIPDYNDRAHLVTHFMVKPPTFAERILGITLETKCQRILDHINDYSIRINTEEKAKILGMTEFAAFLNANPHLAGDVAED